MHIREVFWQRNNMVVHIDASRALELQPTGVNVYAKEIIEHLVEAAPDAQFVLYAPAWCALRAAEIFPAAHNVQWKFLWWPPKFLWTQICLAWVWMWAPKTDAVFFAPAHVAPFFSPRNLIVTIHDVAFEFLPDAFSWRERLFARVMTRMNARAARAILTPSQETKKQLVARYNISPEKIFVTPFALPCVQKKNGAATSEILSRVQQPFILFVGRIEHKKGIDFLLDVAARMPQVQFVLVGKPGIGYEKLAPMIAAQKNVCAVGFVSDETVSALYSAAAAYALPSRYEGFGINILEAFSHGVPLVATRAGSIPEVAGAAAQYADTPEEFTAALSYVLQDQALREKMIAAGFARLTDFTWEKTANKTLMVLFNI